MCFKTEDEPGGLLCSPQADGDAQRCVYANRVALAREALHELTQPLTIVVGAAELLETGPANTTANPDLAGDLFAASRVLLDRAGRLREILYDG
jgi:signal transduction histidine kinase